LRTWYVHRDGEGTVAGGDVNGFQAALDNLIKVSLPQMFEERFKPFSETLAEIQKKTAAPPPVVNPADSPQVAAQVHELNKQIAALTKRSNESEELRKAAEVKAETSDKLGKLNEALNKLPLQEGARGAAFQILNAAITKNDSGDWVGPDGSPVDVYVDKQLTEVHPYFLKPVEVGGAGAQPSSRTRGAAVQLEDIKKGMTPEQRAAVYAQIASLVPSLQRS
jgi:hypothetical protein